MDRELKKRNRNIKSQSLVLKTNDTTIQTTEHNPTEL